MIRRAAIYLSMSCALVSSTVFADDGGNNNAVVDLEVRAFTITGDVPASIRKVSSLIDLTQGEKAPEITPESLRTILTDCQNNPRVKILSPKLRLRIDEPGQFRSGRNLVYADPKAPTDRPTFKTQFVGTQVDATVKNGEDCLYVDLRFKHSTYDGTKDGNGEPVVDSRGASTSSLGVKNGHSVIISGFSTSGEEIQEKRIPLLNKLPVMGEKLFVKKTPVPFSNTSFVMVTATMRGSTP